MRSPIGTLALGLAAVFALTSRASAGGGATKSSPPAEPLQRVSGLATALTLGSQVSGSLLDDINLYAEEPALRTRIAKMMPRARDALRVAMAEYAITIHRVGYPPDADALVRLMQRAIDGAFGPNGAKVLLANLLVQAR